MNIIERSLRAQNHLSWFLGFRGTFMAGFFMFVADSTRVISSWRLPAKGHLTTSLVTCAE